LSIMSDSHHAPSPPGAPIGIYVHIPYCARICPYCDFNVYAKRQGQIPDYVEAVTREVATSAQVFGPRLVATLFIGGGTPSLVPPGEMARIIDAVAASHSLSADAEITMEANPEGLTQEWLRGYRSAGVNRLSIGVQTQQQHGLKVLGRAHRPEVPARALDAARRAGFDNLSLDFIYGWPGQSPADWEHDLDAILGWRPEHVSLYALIVEPGTPYERGVRRGVLRPVDDDRVSDMYERAVDRLSEASWEHYELSNWAREPRFRSQHNQIYWQNGEYLAIGAGAHGHIDGARYSNERLPERYIAATAGGALPIVEREVIDHRTAMSESMMLGLRLVQDGVSSAAFARRHGEALDVVYGDVIAHLRGIGVLEWDGERLLLTRRGLFIANEVVERFLLSPDVDVTLPARAGSDLIGRRAPGTSD
jgi:oxygen-independent coproporphyrinogen III oxidase